MNEHTANPGLYMEIGPDRTEVVRMSDLNSPIRVIDDFPHTFRIAEYPDGRQVIQGAYAWREGFNEGGVTWRDLPLVKVDANGIRLDV